MEQTEAYSIILFTGPVGSGFLARTFLAETISFMGIRTKLPYFFSLVFLLAVTETTSAQISAVGAGFFYNFSGAGGVDDQCYRPNTRPGIFLSGNYDFGVPGLAAQANVRFHQFQTAADCILGPNADGTYTFNVYDALYVNKFNATDLRIIFSSPGPVVMAATLGFGAAWRPSRGNLPYGLMGGSLYIPLGTVRLQVGIEMQYIRVAFDRIQEEWLDSTLLFRSVIRSGTRWASGTALRVGLEVPLVKTQTDPGS